MTAFCPDIGYNRFNCLKSCECVGIGKDGADRAKYGATINAVYVTIKRRWVFYRGSEGDVVKNEFSENLIHKSANRRKGEIYEESITHDHDRVLSLCIDNAGWCCSQSRF